MIWTEEISVSVPDLCEVIEEDTFLNGHDKLKQWSLKKFFFSKRRGLFLILQKLHNLFIKHSNNK